MIFSVTEIETFLRCERRWGLSSENTLNLEPIMNAPHLALGTLVQAALSEWTEDPTIDPVVVYEQLYVVHLAKIAEQYQAHHGFPVSDEELDPLYEQVLLGQHMVANYVTYYKTPLPPGYTAIKTEQRAIVDIPLTEHWECNKCHAIPQINNLDEGARNLFKDLPCARCGTVNSITWQCHQIRGTFDTLVQDEFGKLWILERKTYNQRPKDEVLEHNHQQLGYNWIIRQILKLNESDPNQVSGVLYDGLWKRELESGRKGKREWEELFYRQFFPRPIYEINEFEAQLPRATMKMAESANLPLTTLLVNRTWQGCWDCKLERLCNAMSRGEDADYVKTEYYTTRTALSLELEDTASE